MSRIANSLEICQKLLQLGRDVLSYPLYSPDLHLFHFFQNSLGEKIFDPVDDIKWYLDQFFAAKSQDFFEHGIYEAARKMAKCSESKWSTHS